jgi:hypothetical protein
MLITRYVVRISDSGGSAIMIGIIATFRRLRSPLLQNSWGGSWAVWLISRFFWKCTGEEVRCKTAKIVRCTQAKGKMMQTVGDCQRV